MGKATGAVVAEIHLFKDGDYEYTGRTLVLHEGPEEWIWCKGDYDAILKAVNREWEEYEGFEVFGLKNYVHLA